ncbi:MAG: type II toxin-antitoxin system HicA family toxin, partial [Nitrospiraceae bacterium]
LKRRDFIRELEKAGCKLKKHEAKHDLYIGPKSSYPVSVPRHIELSNDLCKEIRKELGLTGR